MTVNKYGNILTAVLIVLIVAIIVGAGLLIYNYVINPKSDKNRTIEAIKEFDKIIEKNEKEDEETQRDVNTIFNPSIKEPNKRNRIRKKPRVNGYVMVGYITVPKIKLKEPILDVVTEGALNNGVVLLYKTANTDLNEPGNVVIIGHNYRNGKFFSNIKKLAIGDKVKIKDTMGRELTYTIYEKFETTPEDASFYNRDTNGAVEITLSTCTDNAKARTIILARVE